MHIPFLEKSVKQDMALSDGCLKRKVRGESKSPLPEMFSTNIFYMVDRSMGFL